MTTGPQATHDAGGLSERMLSLALLGKYVVLMAYGVWSAVVEVPTFVIVGSPLFAFTWAVLVFAFATAAALGVLRSWATARHTMERWTTAAFVLTFLGYSFALIWRAHETGSWGGASLALIPVAVCILPGIRYYSLVRRQPRRAGKGERA
jgi:hypothetical protein